MAFVKKNWVIDDVVKPEDANRWESALASNDATGTGSVSGGNLVIDSQNPPANLNDYYVDFIAPEDYLVTRPFIINGVNFGAGVVKDIQQKLIPNGAWRAGAPVRIRIVNGSVFLSGGASNSGYWVGATPPAADQAEILLWVDTTTGQLKYRTTPGSATWNIVKGVYNA